MEALESLLDETMATSSRYDAKTDAAVVRRLHELLPLTRREASDVRLWAWPGWVRFPHFVAWRWQARPVGAPGSAARFVGDRVRQCFARLWWAAELTVGRDGDYELTEKLLRLNGFQDVYEAIFGRSFSQHRPAIAPFIEVVGPRSETVVRETAKELGYLLTTLVLEALSEEELREILTELTTRVEARL